MSRSLARIALACTLLLATLWWVAGAALPVRAAADTVSTCDDSGAPTTLRSVISAAAAGDTVNFSCSGTITLGSTITLSKNLTIDGSGQSVTLSGGGSVQVLSVNSGVTVTLNDLTIANGHGGFGGGIANNGGTLTVTNSTLSGSKANADGGGIYSTGTLTVANSTFSGNNAAGGGGIANNGGTLSVATSTFSNNSADHFESSGGGIDSTGPLTVTSTTFSHNTALTSGGGISNFAMATISNSTFSGNIASGGGGGVAGGGGGIYNGGTGNLSVINSTFYTNAAMGTCGSVCDGGGIANYATADLANTILDDNVAASASDDCQVGSRLTDSGGNLADDSSCGFTQSSSKNNAIALDLSPLASNGGPTQTIALGSLSLAIRAGLTSVCNAPPVNGLDQRGFSRSTTSCDSGAYDTGDGVTPTWTPTNTPAPPTNTPVPPTATNTDTPVPPTATNTDTPVPPTSTATNTPIPPTDTPTNTATPLPPVAVTVSGGQTYGSSSPSFTPTYTAPAGASIGGSVSCTTVNGGTAIDPTLAAGSYSIDGASCSGLSAPGDSFVYTGGSFVVAKASQTISFGPLAGKTYGDAPFTVSATASSGLPVSFAVGATDSCTIADTTVTITGAGSCTVTASQVGDTNDNAAKPVAQTFSIAQKALTVTASHANITYGDAAPTTGYTLSYSGGWVGTDGPSLVSGTASCGTAYTQGNAAGAYNITCDVSELSATNYSFSAASPAGTLTVDRKALTITASSATMAYGDPVPAITPLYSGLVNGDAAPATAPTCGTTATSSSGPGTYATSCSGATDPNYAIRYKAGTLTIAQATPRIRWSNPADIVYGTALGATQLDATASVPGTFVYTPSAGMVLHAGSGQALSVTFAPTDTADYTTTAAEVAINVTPAPLTVTAKDQSMVYGGSLPGFTASYSGFVNGDDATTLGGTLSCTTTATAASPVGTYPITCSGQTSSDYSISYKTGTLTITKAPLTITADYEGPVQYSDPLPAFTWQYSGFVNGEGPSVLNGTTSCTTTAGMSTVSSPAGNYPITCSGQSAANYAITYEPGTLTVSPETAAIQYTGATWAQLPGSGSATIALQAQVWDSAASGYPSWGAQDDDGLTSDTPGDVGKMYVQWEIWPAGGCLSGAPSTIVGPVQVTAASAGVGTASASFSQSADGSFCVVAQVVGATPNSTNGYYTANDAQVAGIAFYTNNGQFATGGGWITDAGSSTGKGTFGFTARYGNNGSPKGQMVYVWHGTYNGVPADFIIKSNALSTLSFTQDGPSSYSATLQGKCSYTVISEVDGSQLYGEGNDTFSATATDGDNGASQTSSADSFALTTFQSGNTTLHPIATTALGGGNVTVHN